MQDEFSFLRALYQRPRDDSVRLIYADWLEDQGDTRAEYLRLDVELYRLMKGSQIRRIPLQERMEQLAPKVDLQWRIRLQELRHVAEGTQMDLIRTHDGRGIIEVRGGPGDAVLFVEDKPIALNWDDCEGSIGQYAVFTGNRCGDHNAWRPLEWLTTGEIDPQHALAQQVEPLLNAFASGTYKLVYNSSGFDNVNRLPFSEDMAVNLVLQSYYPEDRNLICTQARETLNKERVEYYIEQIQQGRRPIVVTTFLGWPDGGFVIDGHHKLEAYELCDMRPALLQILRCDPPPVSLEEGLSYLPAGVGEKEYRHMKGKARTKKTE